MRLKRLQNQLREKQGRIREITAALETEDRLMTAEETEEIKVLEAAISQIQSEIAILERSAQRDRDLAASGAGGPGPDAAAAAAANRSAGVISVHDRGEDDPMCGFTDMADFAVAVRDVSRPNAGQRLDERLTRMWSGTGPQPVGPVAYGDLEGNQRRVDAPTNFHQESHTTEGYMVPPEIRNTIFQLIFAEGGMLEAVQPEPTNSNSVEVEADENTPWGATGVQARWRAESAQMTPSQLETKRETVRLHELYAFVLATEELLADAPRLNNRLTQQAGAAIRFKASEAIVTGTGAGQPLGWFNAPGTITIAKEGSQAADTIEAANVLKMFGALHTDGSDTARIFWLANRNTLPQIAVMTIGDQPIWTSPTSGLTVTPGGMLLGYPIMWSEHAETLGDLGDLQLINSAGYYAAVKGGPSAGLQFATSIHLFFDYNIQAFRWIFRLAGQPFLSTPIVANKGDNKSHMVLLAERA